MINIDDAIIQAKTKENISDGGSACFDFGDAVLVKYTCPTEYLKEGEHTREKSEEIMLAINEKNARGVNTPKHLAVKRVVENNIDICYVLQEKCRGFNCAGRRRYSVPFAKMRSDLEFILHIPFEHYKKLVIDGCNLFEMGYEPKNKNLFYDEESGFWYIDFLENKKDYMFDENDITKVFTALKYVIPNPLLIASKMAYNEQLTPTQIKTKMELECAIKAKMLLAIKTVFPNFERYEKFFLFAESPNYKQYLKKEGVVSKDLMTLEKDDYEIFSELYEKFMTGLIDKVVNKGEKFWSVECNDIRNDSLLFSLQKFFEQSHYNNLRLEDFEDKYDYEYALENLFTTYTLNDLVSRLEKMPKNDNIEKFLADYKEKRKQTSEKIY